MTYILRVPGFTTAAIIVEARSFLDALAKADAPDGTTGNAVPESVAAMLESRGVAMRLKQCDCGHLDNLHSDVGCLGPRDADLPEQRRGCWCVVFHRAGVS
jgi:hypothetical protein